MSDPDRNPTALVCEPGHPDGPPVQVLDPRDVPLGGPRAMTVRRTLPHRDRSFVGAWCFVDHYGPDPVADTGGMDVPPHPHAGLQTLTWLFEGRVEHHDSGGGHVVVEPGEVNLMTAGRGIAHSEVSTEDSARLHGVQLWVVLPEADRELPRDLQHHRARSVEVAEGVRARVLIGGFAGEASPVRTRTQLLAVELVLAAGARIDVPVPAVHEHALLVDAGAVRWHGAALGPGQLGVVDAGPEHIELTAELPSTVLLLGGEPYPESIVMWWNFIGRDHAEVAAFRAEWQAGSERFGDVPDYPGRLSRLPAPMLPSGTLRPRGRHGRGH
ncbi:pirin family protein [Actinotalea sp. M2MS4P-6]|uniref:pirin family protein n=1 Tax=Actinotalea sp. M2MS4P-6 TaxID=2983762 RepID=UPI0021E4D603|nr:pirin family protein [Actinotalea sp. M2MS4P-6]MCV2394816.1 pirin family protein [Actinotalea sp. M2MS4P-6]